MQKFKLDGNLTVFDAEVIALTKAANFVSLSFTLGANVRICSDSKSAILALKSFYWSKKPAPETVLMPHIITKSCQYGYTLTLQWIPGHMGIPGNKQADLAAKDATISGEETSSAVTPSIVYAISSIIQKLKHESFINNQAKSSNWFVTRKQKQFFEKNFTVSY